MMRTTFLAVALAALLAAPVASAHPGTRGFARTYPHASRLCDKVTNGHAPKRLAGSTTQVAGACATLKTSFTDAQNAYTNTVAPLKQQAADAVQARRITCATSDHATCKSARRSTRAQLRALRLQWRTAARTYHTSVDAARKTFWTTIRSLRGGATVTPDTSTPRPADPLPST